VEDAMTKRYSIAEARQNLAAIVHELEKKPVIELTRRGEPVAVMMSIEEYTQMKESRRDFWAAYQKFRKEVNLEELNIDDSVFEGLRDKSPGREVNPWL
jgi:antitoxin Phd